MRGLYHSDGFRPNAEPPSRSDAIALAIRSSVERRRKPGRRVNERSEDNPFDVTNSVRDGFLDFKLHATRVVTLG
jgi:hypothetical protein